MRTRSSDESLRSSTTALGGWCSTSQRRDISTAPDCSSCLTSADVRDFADRSCAWWRLSTRRPGNFWRCSACRIRCRCTPRSRRRWRASARSDLGTSIAVTRFAADRPLGVAPATALDYRELARRRLPRQLFDYIDGGAYDEATMRANVSDLQQVKLRQIVMRDVSTRETAVEVLGQALAMPVLLAPVGLGGMFATRAEVQAARAAQRTGIPFIESTLSICSVEEVARESGAAPWFQLYVMRDRSYAEELMA